MIWCESSLRCKASLRCWTVGRTTGTQFEESNCFFCSYWGTGTLIFTAFLLANACKSGCNVTPGVLQQFSRRALSWDCYPLLDKRLTVEVPKRSSGSLGRRDLITVLCGEKGAQQTIWKVLNWQDGGEKVSRKRAAHETRKLKKKTKTEASSHSVKSLTEPSDVSTWCQRCSCLRLRDNMWRRGGI